MAFVVVANWRAKEGEEEACRRILSTMTPLTRAEPGCLVYIANQSTDDPRNFVLYEQYEDEAAFKAHAETDHFKQHVLGDAVPRLENRSRAFYEIVD